MAQTLAGKDQWYVVHVLSGQENKVRENILKRVKTEEMGDLVYDVLVPTERVSEIKKGKKSETTRKFFTGYLIVNMHMLDENNQLVGSTWYFVSDTQGVIWFASTRYNTIRLRGQHARANERARRKGETESQLRSRRIGESRRRPVSKPDRNCRRNRSRARQTTRLRYYFRSRDPGGTGILAGRARLVFRFNASTN